LLRDDARAPLVLFRQKAPPDYGLHSEHIEKIPRHARGANLLRIAMTRHPKSFAGRRGKP
jgi:hypothetical protein